MLNTLKTLNLCGKYAILSLLSVYLLIHLLVVLIKIRLLKLPLLWPINRYIPRMQPLKLNPSLAQFHASYMLKKPFFSMFFLLCIEINRSYYFIGLEKALFYVCYFIFIASFNGLIIYIKYIIYFNKFNKLDLITKVKH